LRTTASLDSFLIPLFLVTDPSPFSVDPKQETLQQEVLVARRMILERNKTGEIIDESVLLKELGISGCLACRTPCQWKAFVDERRASKNSTLCWRGCG
jgi:hypothetical protein